MGQEQLQDEARSGWVVLVGAAVVVVLGSVGLIAWLTFGATAQSPLAAVDRAEERWRQSQVQHYRLAVEFQDGLGATGCRQVVEVRDEQVVTVIENSCQEPPPTVSTLFARVRSYYDTYEGQCGPNGCACDGASRMRVTFDEQLGYPLHSEVRIERVALQDVRLWMQGGFCTEAGWTTPELTVVSFEPLQ